MRDYHVKLLSERNRLYMYLDYESDSRTISFLIGIWKVIGTVLTNRTSKFRKSFTYCCSDKTQFLNLIIVIDPLS